MKLPWSSSQKPPEEPTANKSNQVITDSASNTSSPMFDFEGKRYDFNSLPNDVKELVRGLRVADAQIRMKQETLRVLSVGRQTIGMQMKEKIKRVSPIS